MCFFAGAAVSACALWAACLRELMFDMEEGSHYFDDDDSNASFDAEGSDGDAFNDAPDPFAGP